MVVGGGAAPYLHHSSQWSRPSWQPRRWGAALPWRCRSVGAAPAFRARSSGPSCHCPTRALQRAELGSLDDRRRPALGAAVLGALPLSDARAPPARPGTVRRAHSSGAELGARRWRRTALAPPFRGALPLPSSRDPAARAGAVRRARSSGAGLGSLDEGRHPRALQRAELGSLDEGRHPRALQRAELGSLDEGRHPRALQRAELALSDAGALHRPEQGARRWLRSTVLPVRCALKEANNGRKRARHHCRKRLMGLSWSGPAPLERDSSKHATAPTLRHSGQHPPLVAAVRL